MIRSFKHRGLKRFYEKDDRSKLPPDMVECIKEILTVLDVATDIDIMDIPQFKLHPLKGDRKDQWAVTVRANWRIVFRFEGEPFDVDFTDYH